MLMLPSLAPTLAAALLATTSPTPPPCVHFDHPPTPECDSVVSAQIGQPVTFTVQASDQSCELPVTLEGFTDMPGATFTPPVPVMGNPVSTTFSWTPQAGQEGTWHSSFHAISGCCGSDAWCNIRVNVATPCPPCVDQALGLGNAGTCTVLELGTGQVSITGPAGGVLGDVCIAPGGRLSLTGSEYVTGSIRLGAGASYSHSGSGTTGPVLTNVDLSPEINDAYAAAAAAAALPCTQTLSQIDNTLTITGNGGLNVICVGNIVLNGKTVTLVGGPNDFFVFKITGKLVLNGGGKIRCSGALPSRVLYDVIGTGEDVAFTGGGGGVNCCNSIADGTVLATQRKIALSPGLVNGEVISGRDISIVSGSSVRCPSCP
jgi:hypothetical protein